MQTIGQMSLHNGGGFVAKISFVYLDDNGQWQHSNYSGDITLGFTKTEDPGSLGVPNGSVVTLYVDVVLGKDNQAKQAFLYESGNPSTANYVITGTILDNQLGLINIT